MGLRVTGDQSHPVRFLLRTEIFTHAKVAKAGTGGAFYLLLSTWRPWREVSGFTPPKQTRRALRSVGLSCGERDSQGRLLPVVFFADDSLEVE